MGFEFKYIVEAIPSLLQGAKLTWYITIIGIVGGLLNFVRAGQRAARKAARRAEEAEAALLETRTLHRLVEPDEVAGAVASPGHQEGGAERVALLLRVSPEERRALVFDRRYLEATFPNSVANLQKLRAMGAMIGLEGRYRLLRARERHGESGVGAAVFDVQTPENPVIVHALRDGVLVETDAPYLAPAPHRGSTRKRPHQRPFSCTGHARNRGNLIL